MAFLYIIFILALKPIIYIYIIWCDGFTRSGLMEEESFSMSGDEDMDTEIHEIELFVVS